MKRSTCFFLMVFALALCCIPAVASEDDAIVAVFAYGRTSGWMASGFGVGDGSYVVTSSDAVTENLNGKIILVTGVVVVSRWTGEAYPATVQAVDDQGKIALLKLPSPIAPGVAVASDAAIAKAPKATLGELASGDEVGGKFPTTLYALDLDQNPRKYVVKTWRASNACLTEIRNQNLLFLSKVTPSDKIPKATLVVRPGLGALGVFHSRLIVEGGPRPAVFYKTVTATALRSFLRKASVSDTSISTPQAPATGPSDAAASFQAMCTAVSASIFGTPATAADTAAAALNLRPKNAVANMLSGTALANQGKFDDALKAMNAALEIAPDLPNGRLSRGTTLAAAGKPTEAEQDLRKAVQDQPKDTRPMLALAALLGAKDQTIGEAVKLAKSAVKQQPEDLSAHVLLARLLKHSKDYDGAVAELKSVLESAPKWGEARVALGATYEAAGKPDQAEAEYRKLIENEPGAPDAHFPLIEFLISAGRKDDARQAVCALKKLKLQPDAEEAVKKLETQMEDTGKKK